MERPQLMTRAAPRRPPPDKRR